MLIAKVHMVLVQVEIWDKLCSVTRAEANLQSQSQSTKHEPICRAGAIV